MRVAFKILLSLSCSGSLLILVFLMFRPLFCSRLSKRWQYYIWLVVAARLLLPLASETNLMEAVFHGIENGGLAQIKTILSPGQDAPSAPVFQDDTVTVRNGHEGTAQGNSARKPLFVSGENNGAPSERAKAADGFVIGLCWLMAALILLVRKITIYQSFVKYIKAGCAEVEDLGLLEQFGTLVEQSGVKTAVELSTNHLISSPLLIGFFRPCIVLPTNKLSESEFKYTILHELTHYKRRDMFYKWLVQFTICVHWFNPLVYRMGREVERSCELSCDEAVIQNLDAQGRRAYGDTLLNAIGSGGSYKSAIASVTLGESKDKLEERLNAIRGFRKPSGFVVCFTAVLTIAVCFGAAAAGAYALPLSAPGADSEAKPLTLGPLTLTTKEYTVEELEALNISGFNISLYSDEVSVLRGGGTLKFEYYALNPEEYTFGNLTDPIDQTRWLTIMRFPSDVGSARFMTVTLPEQYQLDISVITTSGKISLSDCTAGSITATTQNGEIVVQGGAATEHFSVKTVTGDVLVSEMAMPDSADDVSYYSAFNTKSGMIYFQPADGHKNYRFVVDYGDDANVCINDGIVEKGWNGEMTPLSPLSETDSGLPEGEYIQKWVRYNQFTLNEDATKKIEFNSEKGTLVVQEK